MDKIKTLSKKKYIRKDKRNTMISRSLDREIKATQLLLSALYKKKFRRKKAFTRIQASDFIAENYRLQRYKLKNG